MILAYFRTIILYLVLILSVRLMGKRQIAQLEAGEFVAALLIADLASVPMQDSSIPLLSGLVPLLTVLGMELVLSFLVLKSIPLRRLLCGRPVILIDGGRVLPENLRRTRMTLDELISHLRQKDILDLATVQYAILETDGNLSVFPFPEHRPASAGEAGLPTAPQSLPITIIEDGRLSREDLTRAGKDMAWLRAVLGSRRSRLETTLLLTVDAQEHVVWIGKEAP